MLYEKVFKQRNTVSLQPFPVFDNFDTTSENSSRDYGAASDIILVLCASLKMALILLKKTLNRRYNRPSNPYTLFVAESSGGL